MKKTGWITFAALAAVCAFTLLACPEPVVGGGGTGGETPPDLPELPAGSKELERGESPSGEDYVIGVDEKTKKVIFKTKSEGFEITLSGNAGDSIPVYAEHLFFSYSNPDYNRLYDSASLSLAQTDIDLGKPEKMDFVEDGEHIYRLYTEWTLTKEQLTQLSGARMIEVVFTSSMEGYLSFYLPETFSSYIKEYQS